MSKANHFLACMIVIVLFAGFINIVGLPDYTHDLDRDTFRLIKVVFELLLVTFAVVMKIVEKISRKPGDGMATFLPDRPELVQQTSDVQKMVSKPQPRKPHCCLCGYDLRSQPNEWMQFNGETTERCPKCSRAIYRDDFGESATGM